jgi:hypothetical protein
MDIVMKRIVQALIISTFLLGANTHAKANIDAANVDLILLYEGHTGVLVKNSKLSDPDGCGRSDYFILPDTHSHFNESYSLLLAAYMANKKVAFTVSECHQGIPKIVHLTLPKQ